jgi:NAD(P)H dehydrogenase (quinone)
MEVLIVHVHPEPTSFNGALTDVAAGTLRRLGHAVTVSDLYGEQFDPVERGEHYRSRADNRAFSALAEQRHGSKNGTLPKDVRREVERLDEADLVIFQFPLWWHAQPAMLKGWFDRVFVNGGLYTSTMRYDRGYFCGKRAICSVTTGAPLTAFGPNGRGGDIERLLWSTHYSLHYMGFSVLPPFLASSIQGHGYAYNRSTQFGELLERHKADWATRLEHLDAAEPLRFPGWEDWDESGRYVAAG